MTADIEVKTAETDMIKEYGNCMLCPRRCGADRSKNHGYCRQSYRIRIARASLHMWEEPCISGIHGSGAVFFTGCNMGCVFCQNKDISRGGIGKEITGERLTEIFYELKDRGANNINLVSADIYIPSVRMAVEGAKRNGFDLPFIFNTSGYVNVESLKSLEGLIDIYLPDMKYIRSFDALRYSNASDYPEICKKSIDEMVRQQPECVFMEAKDGRMLKSGVMVRHLLMPGMLIQAKLIIKYLHERYGNRILISLMNQYVPNGELEACPEIDRPVSENEYRSLVRYAQSIGITEGYIQDKTSADEAFIPEFDLSGVDDK
jgi:putative pyruvate formate lyase activating enzyme